MDFQLSLVGSYFMILGDRLRQLRGIRVLIASPFWLLVFYFVPVCCNAQNLSHGTSIAVIRDDIQIVIAADSRVVDGNDHILADTCKIRSAGVWHFALNGTASTRGMDAFHAIEAILTVQQGTLTDKLESISGTLTPLLNSALMRNPSLRSSVLGVTVFGYEDRTLKLGFLRFVFSNSGFAPPEAHVCPVDCPLGEHRAAIWVPSDDSRFNPDDGSPLMAVRNFVQMEIDRNTTDIGGPIQILKIDRSGASQWIEKPEVCKDQK
jgi:hypothetical protein